MVQAERLIAHQGLAGEFEQDALILGKHATEEIGASEDNETVETRCTSFAGGGKKKAAPLDGTAFS
jgi:hypothetical protein